SRPRRERSRKMPVPASLCFPTGERTSCSFRGLAWVASGREQRLRVREGVAEDVAGVVGAGGEREALAQLVVSDDDAEPVACAVPEQRDGDPVVLAVVELLHRLGRGELGHRCLLLCFRWPACVMARLCARPGPLRIGGDPKPAPKPFAAARRRATLNGT